MDTFMLTENMTEMIIEMIGYLGSILIAVSMLMSSVIKLRMINTVGSMIFAAYALMIHSYPTACMNFFLVAVNIYNLVKLAKKDVSFAITDSSSGDGLLNYILDYYYEDIRKYFPEFERKPSSPDQAYVVCCDGNPAGVLIGTNLGDGAFEVILDYSVPAFRDCSVGTYLYSKLPAKGMHTLIYAGSVNEVHRSYLDKMGFVNENGKYVKRLP